MKRQHDNEPKQVPIHAHSRGPISPYIIHLSHEDEVAHQSTAEIPMDAFVFDDEEDGGTIPETNDLVLDFEELTHQLRESDTQVGDLSVHAIPPRQVRSDIQRPSEAPVLSHPPLRTNNLCTPEPVAVLVEDVVPQVETVIIAFEDESDVAPPPIDHDDAPEERAPRSVRSKIIAVVSFVLIAAMMIFPLHAIQQVYAAKSNQTAITDAGAAAIENFFRGAEALSNERLTLASANFASASEDFSQAEASLNDVSAALTLLANVLPETNKAYDSARGLLTAGRELSQAAASLTQAAEELSGRESFTATTKLNLLSRYVEEALPHVEAASRAVAQVDPDVVPENYRDSAIQLKDRVPALAQSLDEFLMFSETLTTVLGAEQKMRYLLIFQNNTELRATGGFPGSFAEVDVLNGEIVDINIPGGGTYDVQGQLSQFVHAPYPLTLINPRWEFHDANWFPDFPTSAQKMMWFYEQAGGPTVDGVVAINATMMPKLLEITGPIEMPEYGRTIDSENFLFETQKIVEIEYEEFADPDTERVVEAPKQFIGDLAPKILEHLEGADLTTMLSMLDLLGAGLIEKDVQMYFRDNALQSDIIKLGWGGTIKQTEGDYLMIVNTNLGGGKTDAVIEQTVDMHSDIQPDGSIINTVTVTKVHKGLESALFEGLNNVDYIRLYVPKGSQLISADGFEIPPDELFEQSEVPLYIDKDLELIMTNVEKIYPSKTDTWVESGKTVFGNWIQTKPGETEEVTFTYRLPITLSAQGLEQTWMEKTMARLGFRDLEKHTVFIQKQPGVLVRNTTVSVSIPGGKTVVWQSHENDATVTNERDQFIRFLLENTLN